MSGRLVPGRETAPLQNHEDRVRLRNHRHGTIDKKAEIGVAGIQIKDHRK